MDKKSSESSSAPQPPPPQLSTQNSASTLPEIGPNSDGKKYKEREEAARVNEKPIVFSGNIAHLQIFPSFPMDILKFANGVEGLESITHNALIQKLTTTMATTNEDLKEMVGRLVENFMKEKESGIAATSSQSSSNTSTTTTSEKTPEGTVITTATHLMQNGSSENLTPPTFDGSLEVDQFENSTLIAGLLESEKIGSQATPTSGQNSEIATTTSGQNQNPSTSAIIKEGRSEIIVPLSPEIPELLAHGASENPDVRSQSSTSSDKLNGEVESPESVQNKFRLMTSAKKISGADDSVNYKSKNSGRMEVDRRNSDKISSKNHEDLAKMNSEDVTEEPEKRRKSGRKSVQPIRYGQINDDTDNRKKSNSTTSSTKPPSILPDTSVPSSSTAVVSHSINKNVSHSTEDSSHFPTSPHSLPKATSSEKQNMSSHQMRNTEKSVTQIDPQMNDSPPEAPKNFVFSVVNLSPHNTEHWLKLKSNGLFIPKGIENELMVLNDVKERQMQNFYVDSVEEMKNVDRLIHFNSWVSKFSIENLKSENVFLWKHLSKEDLIKAMLLSKRAIGQLEDSNLSYEELMSRLRTREWIIDALDNYYTSVSVKCALNDNGRKIFHRICDAYHFEWDVTKENNWLERMIMRQENSENAQLELPSAPAVSSSRPSRSCSVSSSVASSIKDVPTSPPRAHPTSSPSFKRSTTSTIAASSSSNPATSSEKAIATSPPGAQDTSSPSFQSSTMSAFATSSEIATSPPTSSIPTPSTGTSFKRSSPSSECSQAKRSKVDIRNNGIINESINTESAVSTDNGDECKQVNWSFNAINIRKEENEKNEFGWIQKIGTENGFVPRRIISTLIKWKTAEAKLIQRFVVDTKEEADKVMTMIAATNWVQCFSLKFINSRKPFIWKEIEDDDLLLALLLSTKASRDKNVDLTQKEMDSRMKSIEARRNALSDKDMLRSIRKLVDDESNEVLDSMCLKMYVELSAERADYVLRKWRKNQREMTMQKEFDNLFR